MIPWRYLLTLSRPRFWFYVAGPVLVATAYGARRPVDLLDMRLIALFLYSLLPANVLLYGINDRYDQDVDAANPKKADREARFREGRAVWWALGLSGTLSLLLLWALPAAARWWLAGFLLLAWGYSAPPLRFKARPLWDSLSNGLYILPGVAAYVLLRAALPPAAAILAGWLWTMAMHSFSAIPDIAPDRAAGVATTATLLGVRGTYGYCFVCWLGAALAMAWVAWPLGLLLGLYPALVAVIAWRRLDVHRAYWWYPAINTGVGMLLTMAGLGRLMRGGS